MKVDLFDFDLPRTLIAAHPARPRDQARLLRIGSALAHYQVRDLPSLLRAGDMLVFNDTKVIPARLSGRRGTASVEVTLHKRAMPGVWAGFARPARKLSVGDDIDFAADFTARVVEKREGGETVLDFGCDESALMAQLDRYGQMPLPPYIHRTKKPANAHGAGGAAMRNTNSAHGAGGAAMRDIEEESDRQDYQTLFAREEGAVAAPTAGLHFTLSLMENLAAAGIHHCFVTLHVGAGTFLPVKADDTDDHKMHSEWGVLGAEAAQRLNQTRARGGRIIPVGTTSLRLLESAASPAGRIDPFEGETDIFITPGYKFRAADLLMTNFHLPRSTLFMLVSAFGGLERMKSAYDHAIQSGYRFYSYGDACLIEPQ